jgi:hypothetical protein
MAKHDQRILKFLNQNADRAPTITEMMTRLNISITDISDSLTSLQAQGLITKKVNSQGIECWFPGSSAAPQAIPANVLGGLHASERMPGHGMPPLAQTTAPTAQMPALGGPIAVEARSPAEVRSPFMAGLPDRGMPAPEAKPPLPRAIPAAEREARPVQVQHMANDLTPGPESSNFGGGNLSSVPQSGMNIPPPMYGLAPAPRGVGILTLAAGLVAAVALSAFITTRLIEKEIRKASTTFVDRKALTDANATLADFQDKTKAHVAALEAEIKKLSDEQVSKASADSMKVAATATPAASKEAAPAAKPPKAAKAAAPKVAEAKPAKGKHASAKTKPQGQTAMSKAAARGASMRKKTGKPATQESGADVGDASESAPSSSAPESPSVPNPPGLDDLPPPPAE